jgi:hypothetical protein
MNPEYATQHGAEKFEVPGHSRQPLRILVILLNDILLVRVEVLCTQKNYSGKLSGLSLRSTSPAACFRTGRGTTRPNRKDAAKDSPIMDPIWTNELIESVILRPHETMLQNRTHRSWSLSEQESAGLEFKPPRSPK